MRKRALLAALVMAGTVPVVAGAAPASAGVTPKRSCPVTYGVLITSHKPYRLPAKGQYFKDGPGGTIKVSVTQASTITYSLSASLEVSANYLFASAKASVSGSITKSVAVTRGHEYSHDVHSRKYGNMQYGSNGFLVGWQSNRTNPNCRNTVLATGTAKLPASSVGWHFWETSS
ncbi:hypothetical protein GT045_26135 [Streptomyces sp. SID486]|uniref:hypothetical protein n=1 Tax=unclassified Streptomyces TaxID=2593676 RepID=UPI00136C9D01|nr:MULTISPECIES: hypothetical protein [unclassified Streptomyces]MYW43664.1 hypothetical protein [Streptomyces sp. SID161]MYX98196.1 hypothetical protein [Streptomyces sp. SID486]